LIVTLAVPTAVTVPLWFKPYPAGVAEREPFGALGAVEVPLVPVLAAVVAAAVVGLALAVSEPAKRAPPPAPVATSADPAIHRRIRLVLDRGVS
jgi:hypothetical protein